VKFALIDAERAVFPVVVMCALLSVSPSGYYAWRRRAPSKRAVEDAALSARIEDVHRKSRGTYGSPRVHAALATEGVRTSRKRVGRLMRHHGLEGRSPRRFRRTTDSQHAHPIAENVLDRRFDVQAPNTAWAGDITYIWTSEGWLYLAVLLDLFSRRVVGWAMREDLDRQLCLDALQMALQARQPAPGLLHHTDRGSQYASGDYRRLLDTHGVVCSMSRKGDCWDNAVAESFFGTLKTELVDGARFKTRAEARTAVFEYIEVFYNRRRSHSRLAYRSPVDFELHHCNSVPIAA